MAAPQNTIAGRAEKLGKEIGERWMQFFDWAEALELAHEQRTGQRLKPDDAFSGRRNPQPINWLRVMRSSMPIQPQRKLLR